MEVYRKIWCWAALIVLGLGVAAAATVMTLASPAAGVVVLCLGVALTMVARRLPPTIRHRGTAYLSGRDASLEVQATAALPVLTVACVGLDSALGSAGVRVVLLVGLAGLPLLLPRHAPLTVADILAENATPEADEPRRSVAPTAPPRIPEARGAVATAEAPDTGKLSPTELCHAWQASYRAMLMSADPAERARIAAARGRYLDALAEWDPDGFARWAASGTAAAGDPGAHLGGGSAPAPDQE